MPFRDRLARFAYRQISGYSARPLIYSSSAVAKCCWIADFLSSIIRHKMGAHWGQLYTFFKSDSALCATSRKRWSLASRSPKRPHSQAHTRNSLAIARSSPSVPPCQHLIVNCLKLTPMLSPRFSDSAARRCKKWLTKNGMSSRRERNGGRVIVMTFSRSKRSRRKRPARTASSRSMFCGSDEAHVGSSHRIRAHLPALFLLQ